MLTNEELDRASELISLAEQHWNKQADEHNQWGDLGLDEKVSVVLLIYKTTKEKS